MKKLLIILSSIFLIVIIFIFVFLFINKQSQKDILINDLDSFGMQTMQINKQFSVKLPENFSDANWGLKKIICEEGGYDLIKYPNQEVLLSSYSTNKYYQNEKLALYVLTKEEEIICTYFGVEEGSDLIPGLFSVNDGSIVEK